MTDSTGKTASASTIITVGNTAPTVTINTPLDGDFFAFGDSIPWSVTVTDAEDGPVTGAACANVTVTFVLIHDTHGHAETQQSGCSGVMPTDTSLAWHGGYLAGGLSVSYTDTAQAGRSRRWRRPRSTSSSSGATRWSSRRSSPASPSPTRRGRRAVVEHRSG